MFEQFCALLLRLYPAEFRRAYGGQAVQLMRDRARHERGVFLRLRLLMDLAIDLGATSLHGWQTSEPSVARTDGAPRFDIIEVDGPRPEALAAGMLATMLMLAGFMLLFQPKALPSAPAQVGRGRGAEMRGAASNDSAQQAAATDAEARHKLIVAIAANLKQRYVDRVIGQQLANALLAHDRNGEYESLDMGADLAARVNTDIQTASRALGIPPGVFVADVVYSSRPLPAGPPPPPMTAEMRERNRATMLRQNCLFEAIEVLPPNVGYVKLNGFADATTCQETTGRAMASLNNADALIIDLRDNGGGFGETALRIAGYLFDRPTYMYDPRPHSPVPARTASPVSGNKLGDKPVYVLTSSRTQSAAEYFVYNLKMLKRATVVGETTAGRQHSGAFHRIDDHFGVGIQVAVPPDNPYPVKGWEVIGIEPDVTVSRTEAFEAARRLVQETIAQPQAFESISIRPARSTDPRNMRMRVLPNGDLNASAMPVLLLLRYAYDVPVNPSPRLSGLPGWRETYDIEAKAPANAVPAGLPESEKRARKQAMIRRLLADRFKLVMRVEQKTMPVYALTVASGGPNLQKSNTAEKDCIFDTGTPESCHNFIAGRGHPLNARAVNMDDLAHYIENWTDVPVVNRTALSGLFAVETAGWIPVRLPPPPPGNAPAARFDDLPTIFTVLRKLGLELKKQEAAVPVYTLEHIERPAAE
jgi:uncharacterized protein (TIGR03435 family)